MAPLQKTKSQPDMKQKSLKGYFGKPSEGSAATTTKKAAPPAPGPATKAKALAPSASKSSVASSRASDAAMSSPAGKMARSTSDVESRRGDTPPTSDAIDVDMMPEDVEDDVIELKVRVLSEF